MLRLMLFWIYTAKFTRVEIQQVHLSSRESDLIDCSIGDLKADPKFADNFNFH